MKKIVIVGFSLLVCLGLLSYFVLPVRRFFQTRIFTSSSHVKLYWFIPDGVRAEPTLFNIYEWARQGKLPHIKKMMEQGTYGYAYPNFPSHTPTNFATLLTGAYPSVHGVDDGPMHVIGKPLDSVAIGGFRSVAKKVAPIWKTLEEAGMNVFVLSVPGSTPPELNKGTIVRGRWGGWGADFPAVNFETKGDLSQRIKQGRAVKWFYFGQVLTQYIDTVLPVNEWVGLPKSYSPGKEIVMTAYGTTIYGYEIDTTDDGTINYDRIALSKDKKTIFAILQQGEWSQWKPITLTWQSGEQKMPINTFANIALIKLDVDGFFRIRIVYDNLNSQMTSPSTAADVFEKAIGPMVDFPDNFPSQLIYYPEDKKIFLDEANMSFDWHTKAIKTTVQRFSPDVVIHDIYTPNQMLTSRWWMGYIDPKSTRYNDVSSEERDVLWKEVGDMYTKLDTMIGEIQDNTDDQTYVVISSDHGAVPLNKYVNLNNFFASKGWLKFSIDPTTGEPIIDWKNSQVIYLKMAHVYINPDGLQGNYQRASGPRYEALRNEVITALSNLQDLDGTKPLVDIQKWEQVKEYLQLDPDRAGDLVIANTPGYGWNEEMSADLAVFSEPAITGYKQAIVAAEDSGMWTPFIITGPNIKKNNYLGDRPFPLVDQYPTLMKALGQTIPEFVQGKALDVFTKN